MEDMYNYVQMGYWVILPYAAVQHFPSLCLVLAVVVPQREWWPHPMIDYMFYGTNQACVPRAPLATMLPWSSTSISSSHSYWSTNDYRPTDSYPINIAHGLVSPSFFCALTETIADITNSMVSAPTHPSLEATQCTDQPIYILPSILLC
jgi:hypothetical protein